MSTVALLSDIHGNLPALRSVLADVKANGADQVVFGGDIVGYGASPAECLSLVRETGGDCVMGNHEEFVIRLADNGEVSLPNGWENNPVQAGVVHAFRSLSDEAVGWITELPLEIPLRGRAVLAHAALYRPGEWPYIRDALSASASLGELRARDLDICFVGHVHRLAIYGESRIDSGASDYQLDRKPEKVGEDRFHLAEDAVWAVTVGSVGQSRETGAERHDVRATWVLWDPEERTVEFRRTEYENSDAAARILAAGLPAHSARRLLGDDGKTG